MKFVALQRAFADIGAAIADGRGDGERFAIDLALVDVKGAPGMFDLARDAVPVLLQAAWPSTARFPKGQPRTIMERTGKARELR
jgi:hypothetical protein